MLPFSSLGSQHELECLRACLEEARSTIDKKDAIIVEMEAERTKSASGFENLRERYELLLADHLRLSRLNHELEARLLENDRYKEDCAVAVNLLQTNPDQFLPQTSRVPSCTQCLNGILKPDVTFFGENLPPAIKAEAAALVNQADLLLCLGTSVQTFSSFRLLLQASELRIPIAIVNIGPTRADNMAGLIINSRIFTTLEQVDQLIGN
ncbi:NAD-dependent deacetylase sirtuin 4 [Paragonimus westermani]|uniref:NAD-dependent deacetylase sirtuin 4 n=1 Tax=Paragonimus westermani TaxID=34504 RepID=A0A5J4NNS1_9TREM|nr:NAD-dependent deacetylase sirtuin 4 [Paragonimus westermani]